MLQSCYRIYSMTAGGVVGWSEGVLKLLSPGRPNDIGLSWARPAVEGECSGFFSLSHLLRNQWRNFVETLHMDSSQPLYVSPWRRFHGLAWPREILEITTSPLLNTVTILLCHLLQDNSSDFFKTCLGCSPSNLIVPANIFFWFRSFDKYGRRQQS